VYGRGPVPEKRVELIRLSSINPMKDLSVLGDRVNLSLTMDNQTIDNLIIAQAFLRNVGGAPILPSDYHENLSVSVRNPWKIVTVENSTFLPSDIELRWERVSDTRFEAEPALLNPGDRVGMLVYLTNIQFAGLSASEKPTEPQVKWSTRVTNLRALYEPPPAHERLEQRIRSRLFGIYVELSGWALPFTIVAALLFQALYLHLLVRARFLQGWRWHSISLVLCSSLLGFASAESTATYLFGNSFTEMFGVNHWLNAPPIILHLMVLSFLYQKARVHLS